MEYNLSSANCSVRLTGGSSAPRLSSSSLGTQLLCGADDQVYSFFPAMPVASVPTNCRWGPLQSSLGTGHQSTFPAVSGTAFLSGGDPCPMLRLFTLSFQLHCLECCSSLQSAPVFIILTSQPKEGSDNSVSQDKISNHRY